MDYLSYRVSGSAVSQATTSVTQKKADPYVDLGEVIYWLDFSKYPNNKLLEEKFICLEYSPEKHEQLLEWLQNVQEIVIEEDIDFDSILVFADYDKLNAVQVAKLIRAFDNVGALFTKFPKGCDNFRDAVKEYNKRVGKVKINNSKYDTERKRILEEETVSI